MNADEVNDVCAILRQHASDAENPLRFYDADDTRETYREGMITAFVYADIIGQEEVDTLSMGDALRLACDRIAARYAQRLAQFRKS